MFAFAHRRGSLGLLGALAIFAIAGSARGSCDESSTLGSCVNADALWPHAGPGSFLVVGSGETTPKGAFGFGLLTTFLSKPITLRVPSTSPAGLEVAVIKEALDVNVSASFGLLDRFDLGLTVPVTLYQSGSGIAPYRSSRFEPLPATFLRDPRIGAAYALLPRPDDSNEGLALAARLETSLPFGQADAFAGERGPAVVPTLAADYRIGRWFAGAEVGARARAATRFADARMGTQGLVALGGGVDLLGEALGVAVEAFALPVLVSQPSGGALVPAEWLAEVTSAPFPEADWSFALGGGSALPLFGSAITAPAWRAALSLRYLHGAR